MDVHERLDIMAEDIVDLKIVSAKQELNLAKNTEILGELKDSVVTHVKRSDATDKLVSLAEKKIELLEQKLENKKENDKLVWTVLCAVGAILLALKELGILDKLF